MTSKRSRLDYEADLRRRESPFVIYGTPLPPLDTNARDDGSYVPVWKQEVIDERGRKRLHGAFTGGFSAGYFNTVGSKEGWMPAAFVSSRSNRAKDAAKQQRVEDFMDEEDIQEREEAQQLIASNLQSGFGTQDDASVRHALEDFFRPVDSSVGEKLLMRMGWKKGQGIGAPTLQNINPKEEHSTTHLNHLEDMDNLDFAEKTGTKGLGFGGDNTSITPQPLLVRAQGKSDDDDDSRPGSSFARPSRKPKPLRKTGSIVLGVDTGSDDDDVYSMGPKVSYNKDIGGEGRMRKLQKQKRVASANPFVTNKPVFKAKGKLPTLLHSMRKCHDGKLPLQGFVLADELEDFSMISLGSEEYAPPEVPDDWMPMRLKESHVPDEAETKSSAAQVQSRVVGDQILSQKSVFDFLSPAAREKLATATGKTNLPPAGGERPSQSTVDNHSTHLDPATALAALKHLTTSNFKPYHDPAKQARYEAFLRFSSATPALESTASTLGPLPHTHESHQSSSLERHEFVRAAQVFRPSTISSFLSTRFTSATNTSAPPATAQDRPTSSAPEELITRPRTRPADPAEEAAKMSVFGAATRTSSAWTPTKLVCKRFSVGMPNTET